MISPLARAAAAKRSESVTSRRVAVPRPPHHVGVNVGVYGTIATLAPAPRTGIGTTWCSSRRGGTRTAERLQAPLADVERVRADEDFTRRVRVLLDRDRELLDRLADGPPDDRTKAVDMTDRPVERVLTRKGFNEMLRDAPPPTVDDVSITNDGRRLDSKEAVLELFAQLDAELAAETAAAGE